MKADREKEPFHPFPYASFILLILQRFMLLPATLLLISFTTSAMLGAVTKVILGLLTRPDIYRPLAPRPHLSLCPRCSVRYFFSIFLSASCQCWQSATQTLSARPVTDAGALKQEGKRAKIEREYIIQSKR